MTRASMFRKLILLSILSAVVLALPALLSAEPPDWAKADKAASPAVRVQKDASGASMVNYEDNFIEVIGYGTAKASMAANPAQFNIMAMEAARAMAYAKLAEAVGGVILDAETTVHNAALENQEVATFTKAYIKGARILDEKVENVGGAPMGVVRLGLVMTGGKGMVQNLLTFQEGRKKWAIIKKDPDSALIKISTGYTGVVIDARGLGLQPSLMPIVTSEAGEVVFGPSIVDQTTAMQNGLALIGTKEISAYTDRIGANPLIIKPEGVFGANKAGVKVTSADALKILAVNVATGVLKLGKVLFLL